MKDKPGRASAMSEGHTSTEQAAFAAYQSHRRRFIALAAIFVAVQCLIILLCWAALNLLDIGRAYVAGEALYSKAQKTAVLRLHEFATSGDDRLYGEFERLIAAPLGDRSAREALDKPEPDFAAARVGFLKGRNDDADIYGMSVAFVMLRDWPIFSAAIEEWRGADRLVAELVTLARRIKDERTGATPSQPATNLLKQVERIDRALTARELQFSALIREATTQIRFFAIVLVILGSCVLVIGGLAFAKRISDKGAESELRAWAASEQLADACGAAEAANRSKSAFLANMSHELRTPLNAIIGFSQMIENEFFGEIRVPRYVECANDIHRSGTHLLALINDILDLSRVESGKFELFEEPTRLGDIVDCTLSLCRERAERGGVHLTAAGVDEHVVLHADMRRLKQILINLATNAIKFTASGGTVAISTKPAVDGGLIIEVRDNGVGMSPGELETALTTFGQVDNGLNRKQEGTGLGLPLTKALVELHGGVFKIESARGHGTVVRLLFPRQRVITQVQPPDTEVVYIGTVSEQHALRLCETA